jgi:hypothetical protein
MARATGGGRKVAGKGTGRKENSVSHAEGGQRGSLSAKKAVRRVKVRKECEVEGCTTLAASRGLCGKHGGSTKKECEVEGCTTLASSRGLCCKHGG